MTYPPPPPPNAAIARRRRVRPCNSRTAIWCGRSCYGAVLPAVWHRVDRQRGQGNRVVGPGRTPKRNPHPRTPRSGRSGEPSQGSSWASSTASSPSRAVGSRTCDSRPLVRRAGGSRCRRGGWVRGHLAGEPDGARRDSAGVPDETAAGHRLSGLRQPSDDLLAAASGRGVGGALQRPRSGRGGAAVVGVCGVDLRRARGRRVRSWQHLRWSAPTLLVLTLAWFVVRNLEFGPFVALHV